MARGKGWIKLGVVGLGMAFCLFFGVTLATKGTESIHGPLTAGAAGKPSSAVQASGTEPAGSKKAQALADGKSAPSKTEAAAGKAAAKPAAKPLPRRPEDPATETGINRVGNKAGDLLQIMAYHSIRAIVSLFEHLLK